MLGISTPRQLAQQAELYYQLNQMLQAGVGLVQALQFQLRSPPAPRFRRPIAQWLNALNEGASFSDALERTPDWLPRFDQALLYAGETSGRLPACLKLLADFYRHSASLAKNTLSDLAYPVFLFHFAILIAPFPQLFLSGDILAYLGQVLTVLLPCYLVVFMLLFALQSRRGGRWRAVVEAISRPLPLLGRARRNLALARLAAALEALLSAGVSILQAWPLAAASSGSPALDRAVRSWRPRLEAGETPAEALARSRCFPDLFTSLYHTGEISGELEQTLQRLHHLYLEEGSRQLQLFAQWVPRFLYFAIVLMIAYQVLSFYIGYFGRLQQIIP